MIKVTKFNLQQLLQNHGKKDIGTTVKHLPDIKGDSFILDFETLLKETRKTKCKGSHLLNYIVLASFRDYYLYQLNGSNTLNRELCILTDKEVVENPYLERYGNNIQFKLEPSPDIIRKTRAQ